MIPEGQQAEVGVVESLEHTFSVKVKTLVQTTTNGAKSEPQQDDV